MSYQEFLKIRNKKIDNVDSWTWIESDNGAWDGPKDDWEQSHKEKILNYVKNFGTVVQAGGNQGMYPRLLSDMFDVVYTFEPDPLNFYCLSQNCQKDNIIKIQGALGFTSDLVKVNRACMTNVGMHRVSVDESGTIPQFSLDSLGIDNVDLLMLDIEGYEINAILGAMSTLVESKPVVFAENANDEIQQLMRSIGYELVDVSRADSIFVYNS